MFDDLRNDSEKSPYFQDGSAAPAPAAQPKPKAKARAKFNSKNFLGMNATQRFIVAALLFFMVCAAGVIVLMVTGKMAFL